MFSCFGFGFGFGWAVYLVAGHDFAESLGFLTPVMSAWQAVPTTGCLVALSIMGAMEGTLFVLLAGVFASHPRSEGKLDPGSLSACGERTSPVLSAMR